MTESEFRDWIRAQLRYLTDRVDRLEAGPAPVPVSAPSEGPRAEVSHPAVANDDASLVRFCAQCGKVMERKRRAGGMMENAKAFAVRKYCDTRCMAEGLRRQRAA